MLEYSRELLYGNKSLIQQTFLRLLERTERIGAQHGRRFHPYGAGSYCFCASRNSHPNSQGTCGKEEEKAQIYAWLVEAREFALDAENSNKKHAAFGKYKGRINNYLAKRGYDLKKEREEWYKRVKARGGSL